ncbi:hypothetical protein TPHA_0B04620 [Tetrapisispora phaffii CBS 4417]|uniref:ABC transporter domain-containing protein n=1 Tax=Tetrapisispora phaffii (strain ATCC 24235 / CBS 4417 / NBRC 1672 / NRRL Y-8282 / UCD 70-5) TaxID=1071381 RepID=G8BQ50_TETPH|nr:hypothetical protein TPHA_0B04620 [Tetrapisispora phaffii CBS 4417]CCE62131.1 hypothetical protein TPHA_0B04620 [Tetrapisispora phaffii CBS 4417]
MLRLVRVHPILKPSYTRSFHRYQHPLKAIQLIQTKNIINLHASFNRSVSKSMILQQTRFNSTNESSKGINTKLTETQQKLEKLSSEESTNTGFKDVKRLFTLAKPETAYIVLALVLILISSTVSMVVPSVIGKLLDLSSNTSNDDTGDAKSKEKVDNKEDRDNNTIYGFTHTQFFAGLGIVFVIGAIANTGRIVILKVTGEKLVARLRTRTMKAALDQDATFLDSNRVGDLISRLSSDASIVAKSVTMNVSDGTRAILQGFVGFSMMSYISFKLTSVMVLLIPPLGIMALVYGKKIRNLSRQLQTAVGGLTKVAEEQLNATKTIQAYGGEKKEIRRYASEVRDVFDVGLKEAITSGIFFGSTGLVGNAALLSLLLVGTNMISSGSLTVGDLSSFMMYAVYTGSSLFGLSSFYSELMKGAGAAARVFELDDRKPLIKPTIGKDPVTLKGKAIIFQDVSFHYPTRPNHRVFNKISFKIEPGEHICFVGPSGSGKSTVSQLLLRYYDATEGNILIGEDNIKSLSLRKYRKLLGVVQQEPMLFNGTIIDNILYNVPDEIASQKNKVDLAIKKSNCTKFLANFPDGLNTIVGPRGTQLSGGQKQRIAIARSFLLDPSILLLDEATSALDTQSEDIIAMTLKKREAEGLTTISIAHRLSTIKYSSRVVVLNKNGSVVETGKFTELIANPTSELNLLLSKEGQEPAYVAADVAAETPAEAPSTDNTP